MLAVRSNQVRYGLSGSLIGLRRGRAIKRGRPNLPPGCLCVSPSVSLPLGERILRRCSSPRSAIILWTIIMLFVCLYFVTKYIGEALLVHLRFTSFHLHYTYSYKYIRRPQTADPLGSAMQDAGCRTQDAGGQASRRPPK